MRAAETGCRCAVCTVLSSSDAAGALK